MLEGHTMRFPKIKQRVAAMDLSGPKAFAESLTPQSNLAVGDVDFDSFSSAVALSLTLSLSRRTSGTWSGTVEVPALPEGTIRSGN